MVKNVNMVMSDKILSRAHINTFLNKFKKSIPIFLNKFKTSIGGVFKCWEEIRKW